ncbi:hypothetical protein FCV25MIE_07570 [Fagus crenata]
MGGLPSKTRQRTTTRLKQGMFRANAQLPAQANFLNLNSNPAPPGQVESDLNGSSSIGSLIGSAQVDKDKTKKPTGSSWKRIVRNPTWISKETRRRIKLQLTLVLTTP